MANQPMLPKSHTNSADLTSRLPDGRSTRDRGKLAKYVQTLKRNASHLRGPASAAPRSRLISPPEWAGRGRAGEALRQFGKAFFLILNNDDTITLQPLFIDVFKRSAAATPC